MNKKSFPLWSVVALCLSFAVDFFTSEYRTLAVLLLIIGVSLLLYHFMLPPENPTGLLGKIRLAWLLRVVKRISLHEAARLAYDEARAKETLWAGAAERLGVDKSPNGVLDYVATCFGREVPIYGQRELSLIEEVIDRDEVARGEFKGGALWLELDDGASIYRNLTVEAKDFSAMLTRVGQKVFPDGAA